MNIYVGNLSFKMSEDSLRSTFESHGTVESAKIITGPDGRSKGFGFVEMPEKGEAEAAISALNGKEIEGRALTVNEARPREERPRGPRGGGRGGFGGGKRF